MVQKSNMLEGSTIWDVVSVFFKEPTHDHYLKEISKKANLAHTSVKKHLEELKKQGIIKEILTKRGSRDFPIYVANLDGGKYRVTKRHYNQHNMSFYGLIHFISLKLMPKCMVLFGSYCKGQDTEDSDIDIFVECKKQDIDLKKYEAYNELNRKIQLHFKENFKEYPKELKNNIVNGVIISGYLEAY